MPIDRIYISATNQHVGKTTTTLGLVHSLRTAGINVGYCKPVGQKYVIVREGQVDKDAVLFSTFMDFDLEPNIHSPVILGKGSVTDYLDDPSRFHFPLRIDKAARVLSQRHELVVYEGTGHPGVGSVVDVSNADVAHMLGAGVIMVVEAGIGSTIDRLYLSMSVFEQKGVPVIGVIVNKTIPQKMEKIRKYVGKKLESKGIPLLGVMPYEEELALPLMRTIAQSLNGKVLYHEDHLDNRVQDILAGSLIDRDTLKSSSNILLVVSINRLDDALKKLRNVSHRMGVEDTILSGIISTGKGQISDYALEYIEKYKTPVVHSQMDTYESVIKISQLEVKINTRTPWKITKAVTLFQKHINTNYILDMARERSS